MAQTIVCLATFGEPRKRPASLHSICPVRRRRSKFHLERGRACRRCQRTTSTHLLTSLARIPRPFTTSLDDPTYRVSFPRSCRASADHARRLVRYSPGLSTTLLPLIGFQIHQIVQKPLMRIPLFAHLHVVIYRATLPQPPPVPPLTRAMRSHNISAEPIFSIRDDAVIVCCRRSSSENRCPRNYIGCGRCRTSRAHLPLQAYRSPFIVIHVACKTIVSPKRRHRVILQISGGDLIFLHDLRRS